MDDLQIYILFSSISIVFQTYQDDGMGAGVIMKRCVQWNPVYYGTMEEMSISGRA